MVKKMNDEDKKYVVLKHKDYAGVTVKSGVAKPGQVFARKDFRGDDEDFAFGLKDKRFEEFTSNSVAETEEKAKKKYITSLESQIDELKNADNRKEVKALEKINKEQAKQIESLETEKSDLLKQVEEQAKQIEKIQGKGK